MRKSHSTALQEVYTSYIKRDVDILFYNSLFPASILQLTVCNGYRPKSSKYKFALLICLHLMEMSGIFYCGIFFEVVEKLNYAK